MTPKEKAEELFYKMSFETHKYNAKSSIAFIYFNFTSPLINQIIGANIRNKSLHKNPALDLKIKPYLELAIQ